MQFSYKIENFQKLNKKMKFHINNIAPNTHKS